MNERYKIQVGDYLYSTSGVQSDSSGQWLPYVVGAPNLSRNIGDGKTYQTSSVTFALRNDDGAWSVRLNKDGYALRGKTVQVWDEEDTLLFTGAVEKYDLDATNHVISITASDYITGVQEDSGQVITAADYPNAATEAYGQPIKRIYGTVAATGGALTLYNTTAVTGTGKFLVADHWVTSVDGLFEESGDAYTVGYTLDNNADGRAYVTLTGGTGRPTIRANVTGRVLGAGTFDGTGDYVSLGNPAGLQLSTGTIVVRLNTTGTSDYLIGKFNAWHLQTTAAGRVFFRNYTTATNYASTGIYNDGNDHIVVYRFDGTSADMVIDCTETVTGTTVPVNQASNAFIGSISASAGFYQGIIRDVQIYNTKATDAQVQELSNGKVLSGCLAHYTFDEGTGTTITDRTGNGYNGTLTTADAAAFWANVAPMTNPADCLRDILAGSNLSYDCRAWKATREALDAASMAMNGFLRGDERYQDVLSTWGKSFWTDFCFTENGELRTIPPLQAGDLSADADFADIYQSINTVAESWEPQYAPEEIVNTLTLNYGRTEYSGGFIGTVQATDSTSVTNYGTCQETLEAPYVGDATTAGALKDAIFADLATPPVYAEATLPDTESSAGIGDYIKFRDVGEYQDSADSTGLFMVLQSQQDLIHRKRLRLRDVKSKV